MRYVYNDTAVIMVVEDNSAIIRSTANVIEFPTTEEAIEFFEENNIDYSILVQN